MSNRAKTFLAYFLGWFAIIGLMTGTATGRSLWSNIKARYNITRAYANRGLRFFIPIKIGQLILGFLCMMEGMYVEALFFAMLFTLELFASVLILGGIVGPRPEDNSHESVLRTMARTIATIYLLVAILPFLALVLIYSEHTWGFMSYLLVFWYSLMGYGTYSVISGNPINPKPYFVMLTGVIVVGVINLLLTHTMIGNALKSRGDDAAITIANAIDDQAVELLIMTSDGVEHTPTDLDLIARTAKFAPTTNQHAKDDTLAVVDGVPVVKDRGALFVQVRPKHPTTGLYNTNPVWVSVTKVKAVGKLTSNGLIRAQANAGGGSGSGSGASSFGGRGDTLIVLQPGRHYSLASIVPWYNPRATIHITVEEGPWVNIRTKWSTTGWSGWMQFRNGNRIHLKTNNVTRSGNVLLTTGVNLYCANRVKIRLEQS